MDNLLVLSALLVCCEISCVLSAGPFASTSEDCDYIDPLSGRDGAIDHKFRAGAMLSRSFFNTTSIGVSWIISGDEDIQDLCGYTLHWARDGNGAEEHQMILKHPSVTSHVIDGLEPGTKYWFYVLAYYATGHTPKSWKISTLTDGCGPNNPFYCDSNGSAGCNRTTGECICKTVTTSGMRCNACPKGFYMHELGCTTCMSCLNDTSYGTCSPDGTGKMNCDCIPPHAGKYCRECVQGYYVNGSGICKPCQCIPSEEGQTLNPTCDLQTGKCFCDASRTGDRCELCADGYHGDALGDGCFRGRHGAIAAAVVIVMLIVVAIPLMAYFVCLRNCRNRRGTVFWNLRRDRDKVNFTTLEEELDIDEKTSTKA